MHTAFSGRILLSCCKSLLLAAVFCMSAAHADDYAEVTRLSSAGQLPQALTKADEYLAARPRDPQMRFLKGVIQGQLGQREAAIATLNLITEDYPELPEPHNNLAVLYAAQGQLDKAKASLETALRINPAYATAHENLGDVYAQLASQSYSRALQLQAGNTALPQKLALIRQALAPAKAP